jgi:hypothetical protein
MHLVRHLEHMVVGSPPFDRVGVEQRRFRRAAHYESEFPGDISGVHNRRVHSLSAERTGQMAGIAQQETPPIARALSGAPVHLEIGNPSEIVQANVDADARIEQCAQLVRGRKLASCISLVAIDENEPAVVRQWREQPRRVGDEGAAVAVERIIMRTQVRPGSITIP